MERVIILLLKHLKPLYIGIKLKHVDILTHTISGLATGTVIAAFSKRGLKEKLFVIGTGGFAAALPDLDAISLWSGFDSTFGRLFNLENSGRVIYSAKYWYSHHAFMHSVLAALLMATLFGLFSYLISEKLYKLNIRGVAAHFKSNRLLPVTFVLAFLVHLIQDMPTPASAWGGVNLFWPSNSYIGGFGDIWWWNNYDIFLITFTVLLINLALLAVKFVRTGIRQKTIIAVFVLGCIFSFIQIKTRDFDFKYKGNTNLYYEFEAKSKELQKEILGERLYDFMVSFDNKLKFYF